MQNLRTFVVIPSLPEELEPLRMLAYNMWWSWTPAATDLFWRLDTEKWEAANHNPVALLWQVSQERLQEMAMDKAYTAQLTRVADAFYVYRHSRTWFDETYPDRKDDLIAYFSAEFGIHESLPVYSGGLGVLAGDHLKSASDLGIPLVGVGLMYRNGYFNQQLTEDGWQIEQFQTYDFHQWPATLVKDDDDRPIMVSVSLSHQEIKAQIWRVDVGSRAALSARCGHSRNPPELRAVTSRLYGGDNEMRIRQEILLGIGGYRALRAIGRAPTVCHMNEGHAAFMALERIRNAIEEHNLSYAEAREAMSGGNIFTTHTPVPAGIDRFHPSLVERYVGDIAHSLGLSVEELLQLGRENPRDTHAEFCMPVLALRTAYRSNGVSELHGEVSRKMWQMCWPNVPSNEIPISHVTNGIHTQTWISQHMADLLDQYLSPVWSERPDDPAIWARLDEIPDGELWRVHERRRDRLIAMVRDRVRKQLQGRGAPPSELRTSDEVLDPRALTIGFARRFAPYKRATLLFRSIDRLRQIVNNSERPVQFVFAGKSHPADAGGKELIKQISAICNKPEFRRKIVFIENYDMCVARTMVRGVDVWLNNPLRLHEASGTSGMKVPPNGGLNLSCLDGWWPEAYDGENGWAIGDGRVFDDTTYQDHVESESLYNLLEREIIPLFYDRSADDVPRRWVARIKASMKTICPQFSTHRMLKEYNDNFYQPAVKRYHALNDNKFKLAKQITQFKKKLAQNWDAVKIAQVVSDTSGVLKVGDELPLTAKVALGSIAPKDVAVEAYVGSVDVDGNITNGVRVEMEHSGPADNGLYTFTGAVPCSHSGRYGYRVRVVPNHPDLPDRYVQGLLVWG
jgi:starch phosphorylase